MRAICHIWIWDVGLIPVSAAWQWQKTIVLYMRKGHKDQEPHVLDKFDDTPEENGLEVLTGFYLLTRRSSIGFFFFPFSVCLFLKSSHLGWVYLEFQMFQPVTSREPPLPSVWGTSVVGTTCIVA